MALVFQEILEKMKMRMKPEIREDLTDFMTSAALLEQCMSHPKPSPKGITGAKVSE